MTIRLLSQGAKPFSLPVGCPKGSEVGVRPMFGCLPRYFRRGAINRALYPKPSVLSPVLHSLLKTSYSPSIPRQHTKRAAPGGPHIIDLDLRRNPNPKSK